MVASEYWQALPAKPGEQEQTPLPLIPSAQVPWPLHGDEAPPGQAVHDELCKQGPAHCPAMLFAKEESHMSEVFSIDTKDKTVSGPILAWIKK